MLSSLQILENAWVKSDENKIIAEVSKKLIIRQGKEGLSLRLSIINNSAIEIPLHCVPLVITECLKKSAYNSLTIPYFQLITKAHRTQAISAELQHAFATVLLDNQKTLPRDTLFNYLLSAAFADASLATQFLAISWASSHFLKSNFQQQTVKTGHKQPPMTNVFIQYLKDLETTLQTNEYSDLFKKYNLSEEPGSNVTYLRNTNFVFEELSDRN